jgi:anhydro-N-acetylmuramic acid kinase
MSERGAPSPHGGEGDSVAIGVISGTSMDGIDVALIESDGRARLKTGPSATFPYPPAVAERLRAVVADLSEAQAPQLELERLVTDAHVAGVEAFLARCSIARDRVALVGLHGQTILHRPRAGLTRQLCDGARAAAALKIDVVSDFRSADVAAGGEGAPLAPVYHAAMAAGLERPLMILNWGGVGNVTYLGVNEEIIAFDTGPANALIDDFLILRRGLEFDENGALGASGRVDAEALTTLMSDPYFDRAAPKSLDRNHFNAAAACVKRLSDADGAATLSAFTVESTAAALKHVPQASARWLVAGGGRRNPNLMRRLSQRLQAKVEPIEAIGFDGDSVEAQCFAYCALRSRRGLPISFPTTTGVPKPMAGGVFWPARK